MKHRLFVGIGVLAFGIVAAGAVAHGQTATLKTTFPFVAGNTEMPSGEYTIQVRDSGQILLREKKGSLVALPIVANAGRHEGREVKLVFDKTGGTFTLAEIWIPGHGRVRVRHEADPDVSRRQ